MAYTALSAASAGQLINAAWMNTYVRDNINALNGNGTVPNYVILWLYSSFAALVDNWYPCYGDFGIIDLRDRAIVGAGSTYAVHDVGGAVSAALAAHTAHSLSTPAHGNHSIFQSGSHNVVAANSVTGVSGTFVQPNLAGGDPNFAAFHHDMATSDAATHSSAALTDTHAHSGTPFAILPPYLALLPTFKAAPTLSVGTPRTWADGDVPTAAMFNADLRDAFKALRQRTLWPGMIIMWSGSLAALPDGYQLCNGTNGTPDMRDRFTLSSGLSYAVGVTGGALTLSIPAHSNHSPTQANDHGAHAAVLDADHGAWVGQTGGGLSGTGIFSSHSVTMSGNHGSHSGFAVDAHSAHDVVNTVPPYIALGYIQLISATAYTEPRTWATGELVDAGRVNTYVRDNESALYTEQVPIGAIFAFHESIASIPANYSHVNGSGGLVDTRDRFILGAGSSYAVTAIGGATSQTPAAHPAHVITQPTAHAVHGVTQPAAHSSTSSTSGGVGGSKLDPGTGVWSHSYTIDGPTITAQHAHAFAIDGGAAHSAHAAMSLLPPYHALAFIQRVS